MPFPILTSGTINIPSSYLLFSPLSSWRASPQIETKLMSLLLSLPLLPALPNFWKESPQLLPSRLQLRVLLTQALNSAQGRKLSCSLLQTGFSSLLSGGRSLLHSRASPRAPAPRPGCRLRAAHSQVRLLLGTPCPSPRRPWGGRSLRAAIASQNPDFQVRAREAPRRQAVRGRCASGIAAHGCSGSSPAGSPLPGTASGLGLQGRAGARRPRRQLPAP